MPETTAGEREFTVRTKPLPENRILAFRMQAAAAELEDGTRITWDHTFRLGGLSIATTIVTPDGRHITETADLRLFLQEWADEILRESHR